MAELRMTHRHATEDELRQLEDNGFAAWLRSYVSHISYYPMQMISLNLIYIN